MWIQAGVPSIAVAFAQLTVHKPSTITGTCARTSVFFRQHDKNDEEGCCCTINRRARATSVLLSSASTALPAADGALAIPRHERKAARRRRSFRRRQAPITRGQRKTLRELLPKYGLVMDYKNRWDFDKIFSRPPPPANAAAGDAAAGDAAATAAENEAEMAAADNDVADAAEAAAAADNYLADAAAAAAAAGGDEAAAAAKAGGDGDAMAVRGARATSAAVTLDIGFGLGESLLGMAAARPDDCFLGIEVHKPGVATALGKIEAQALTNVRIVQGDVITALSDHLEDRSLNECCIFFPDPFPGDSDADRRLVRPLLLSLLSSKLRPGGALHLATDVEEYAEHIERVMSATTRPEKKKQTESSYSPPPLPGTFSPKSVALSELEWEPIPELEPVPESGPESEPESESGPEPGPESGSEPRSGPESGPGSELGSKPGSGPGPGSGPEPEPVPESGPEREPEPGSGWESKLEGFLARGEESPAQFFLSVDFSARRPRKAPGGGVQAAEMMGVEGACLCWEGGETLDRPAWRPLTSYERKAREAGRRVRDFSYRLEVPSPPLSPPPPPPL